MMYTLEEIIRMLEFYEKQGLSLSQLIAMAKDFPDYVLPKAEDHVSNQSE